MSEVQWLTKEEAIAAIERCASDVTEELSDGTVEQRRVVHSMAGSMGCDWDTFAAIEAIEHAVTDEDDGRLQIGYTDTMFGRCLAVVWMDLDTFGPDPTKRSRRRSITFDSVKPEKVS